MFGEDVALVALTSLPTTGVPFENATATSAYHFSVRLLLPEFGRKVTSERLNDVFESVTRTGPPLMLTSYRVLLQLPGQLICAFSSVTLDTLKELTTPKPRY